MTIVTSRLARFVKKRLAASAVKKGAASIAVKIRIS